MVRESERLHEHVSTRNPYPFLRAGDSRRMAGMKRVERLQGTVVQVDADSLAPWFAGKKSMKDQLEMRSCLIQLAHEVTPILNRGFAVPSGAKFLPDDKCSTVAEMFCPWNGCQIVGHANLPTV